MKRLVLILLAVSSCSFVAGSGFNECDNDTQCSNNKVCLEHYCVQLYEDCRREVGKFDDPNRILVAAALPLTPTQTDGTRITDQSEVQGLNSITLAMEEVNVYEGVNGRRFALMVCDTHRETATIKNQVAWLQSELKAQLFFTSGSQQTLAAAEVTADAGSLIMSATSTSPALVSTFVQSGGLVWRTAPSDTLQARALANLLLTDPAYTMANRIGVIFVNDAYGIGLSSELREVITRGGRTIQTAGFEEGKNDTIDNAVNTIAGFGPKVTVVIAIASDTKRILESGFDKNLKASLGHRWVFADASKDPDIFTQKYGIAELQGSLGTAPAQGAGAAFPFFKDDFTNRFKVDPSSYSFTSHAYDAMYVLALASAYATTAPRTLSGATVAEGIGRLSSGTQIQIRPDKFGEMKLRLSGGEPINVEGNSGPLDFIAGTGAPISPIEIWRAEADAGFSTLRTVQP